MAQKMIIIRRGGEHLVRGSKRLDNGSKRQLKQIRWKRGEVISATLLFVVLTVLAIWFAIWFTRIESEREHFLDPPQSQEVKDAKTR